MNRQPVRFDIDIQRLPPGPAYWSAMCPVCGQGAEKLQGHSDGAMWAEEHLASCKTSRVFVWCALTFARVDTAAIRREFEEQLEK